MASFREKILALYSDKVVNLGKAHGLSVDIDKLLNMGRVFPTGSFEFCVDEEPEIGDTLAVFQGTNGVPFRINPQGLRFTSRLEFYLDNAAAIQLRIRFTVQAKGSVDYFSFGKHYPDIPQVFKELQFDEFAYLIVSQPEDTVDGIRVVAGANVVSTLRLTSRSNGPARRRRRRFQSSDGDNPFVALSFFWAEKGFKTLPFGGLISPPKPEFKSQYPKLCLASPSELTGLELGHFAFRASAVGDLPDESEVASDEKKPRGVGAALPLPLGGPLNDLCLRGLCEGDSLNLMARLEGKTVPSLDAFTKLGGGPPMGSMVPAEFPLSNQLFLEELSGTVALAGQESTFMKLGLQIRLDVKWNLLPQLAALEDVRVQFLILWPLNLSMIDLQPFVRGRVRLEDSRGHEGILNLDAVLPTVREPNEPWAFSGLLEVPEQKDKRLDVFGVLRRLLPGLGEADWRLWIDSFGFRFSPGPKTFEIELALAPGSGLDTLPLGLRLEAIYGRVLYTTNGNFVSLGAKLEWKALSDTSWQLFLETGRGVWRLSAELLPGKPLHLSDLLNKAFQEWHLDIPPSLSKVDITELFLELNASSKEFVFQGALDWEFVLFEDRGGSIHARVAIQSSKPSGNGESLLSGEVQGDFDLLGFQFHAAYRFQPDAKEIEFRYQEIQAFYARKKITDSEKEHDLLSIRFGDTSLGDVLSSVIRVADPGAKTQFSGPWAFLNAINFDGLLIDIDFTDKVYRARYRLNQDFAVIKIDTLGVEYRRRYGKGQIKLLIEGDFFGKIYNEQNALAWDPVNEEPPSMPGAGKAAFDLHYLAFGQHVSLRDASQMGSVEQVLASLAGKAGEVANPSENPLAQLPGLAYNSGSGWIIASQFVVNRFLTFGMVFNDPQIYGLLVTAGGPAAGALKGLRFEILYTKISDTVGRWHVDLTLPTPMRKLQLGAVTITLPVAAIDIYTNGDFRLDMGFPPSITDYSRCFALEIFPFIGFGGFYFAKLSTETAAALPPIVNGAFHPVIAAGVAIAVGLGKTLEVGILSGGIYITITGLVEGVYSTFEPEDRSLPTDTYFSLKGTVAIVGKVYAKVDFGIVKAGVDLTAWASVTLRVAVYEPILVSLEAAVRVTARVKVVFVTIRFSFEATIRQKFVIGVQGTPPWKIGDSKEPERLLVGAAGLLHASHRDRRRAQRALLETVTTTEPVSHLAAGEVVEVRLWATPVISKAQNTDLPQGSQPPTDLLVESTDEVAIAVSFFAPAAAPQAMTVEALRASAGPVDPDGVEALLSVLLRRALDIAGVGKSVSADQLESLFGMLQEEEFFLKHFAYEALTTFLSDHVRFSIGPRPVKGPNAGAFVPMIPELTLAAPDYFKDFGKGSLPEGYVKLLDKYFQQMEVDFANSVERNPEDQPHGEADRHPVATVGDPEPGETMAGYVFTRWFLAMTRSAVQAALSELELYHLSLSIEGSGLDPKTASLQDVCDYFGAQRAVYRWQEGDTLTSVAAVLGVPPEAFEFPESAGEAISDLKAGSKSPQVLLKLSPFAIVEANQMKGGILRTWPAREAGGGPERPTLTGVVYTVRSGDAFGAVQAPARDSVAARFGIPVEALVKCNRSLAGIFQPGQKVAILPIGKSEVLEYTPTSGATLQAVALYYEQSPLQVVQNDPVIQLGEQKLSLPDVNKPPYSVRNGQTLKEVAADTGVTENDLLSLNQAILLNVAGAPRVRLKEVAHTITGGEFVVPFIFRPGDTLDSIVRFFYPDSSEEVRREQEERIRQWNPLIDFNAAASATPPEMPRKMQQGGPRPPVPGDVVSIPYLETFDHLAITFFGDKQALERLIINDNTDNHSLLRPGASLNIPTFDLTINEETTFASLASQYGLTLEQLAEKLAVHKGIFRDPIDGRPVNLAIEDLHEQPVDRLILHLEESMRFTEAASMATHFMMHGLRIPEPGDPALVLACDTESDRHGRFEDIKTYPLYSLVGQEFRAPRDMKDPTIVFSKTDSLNWVAFEGGGETLKFSLASEDLKRVADFRNSQIVLTGIECRPLPLARTIPARQALGQLQPWMAGELPLHIVPSDQSGGNPLLARLPESFQEEVLRARESPLFGLFSCRTAPGGSDVPRPLRNYGWATTVEIGIRAVEASPAASSRVAGFYLLEGADEIGKERLFKLWKRLHFEKDAAQIFILYRTDPTRGASGYVSDALNRPATRILKVNLSTLSHDQLLYSQAVGQRTEGIAGTPQGRPFWTTFETTQAAAVVELLWQNSVTRSGGFFLTYRSSDGAGLPGYLFDSEGRAQIMLLVILESQIPKKGLFTSGAFATEFPAPVYDFNNVAAVGEPVDPSQEVLCAEVAVIAIPPHQTLTEMSRLMGAPRFTPEKLAQAQARVPGLLLVGAELRLDGGKTIQIETGDTWAGMAARFSTTVETLAQNNADNPVFCSGGYHPVQEGFLEVQAVLPPGTTGFEVVRPRPEQFPQEVQQALQELFSLIGFRVVEDEVFCGSAEGLPAGPVDSESETKGVLSLRRSALRESEEGTQWRYYKALRLSELAIQRPPLLSPVLPEPSDDPYAGITLVKQGKDTKLAQIQLALYLQDILGNRTAAPDIPHLFSTVGYTDQVIGLDQWPGVASFYRFTVNEKGCALLEVIAGFAADRYVPIPGRAWRQAHQAARLDRQRYSDIHYQVRRSDLRVALSCTLASGVGGHEESSALLNRALLRDLEASIFVFLAGAEQSRPLIASTTRWTWGTLAAHYGADSSSLAVANSSALVRAVFAETEKLSQPKFCGARDQDTLIELIERVKKTIAPGFDLTTLVEKNGHKLLRGGTAIFVPIRSAKLPTPISLREVLQKYSCAALSQVLALPSGGSKTLPGLIEANPAATLVEGQVLSFSDKSYKTQKGDTFKAAGIAFAEAGAEDASAEAVALTNQWAKFEPQSLQIPNRVLKFGDSLDSVAAELKLKPLKLAQSNDFVPDLYPSGTQIEVKVIDHPVGEIGEATTLQSLADTFGLTLAEFGAWQEAKALASAGTLEIPSLVDTSSVENGLFRFADGSCFSDALGATTGFDETCFLKLNASYPGLFVPGQPIPVGKGATTSLESTFQSLALEVGVEPEMLFGEICHRRDLVRPGAVAFTPALWTREGDTLGTAAARLGVLPAALGSANASTMGLLVEGAPATFKVESIAVEETVQSYDTLGKLASRFEERLRAVDEAISVSAAQVASQNPNLPLATTFQGRRLTMLPPVPPAFLMEEVQPTLDAAIRPLRVSVSLERGPSLVHPEFAFEPRVQRSIAVVRPAPFADKTGADDANQFLSLRHFARQFEEAFPGFKLATGQDRGLRGDSQVRTCGQTKVPPSAVPAGEANQERSANLWAVYFRKPPQGDNGFTICADPRDLAFFALKPLSTKLWASPQPVEVPTYESGVGLGRSEKIEIQSADVDQFAREFLATMDQVLSPVPAREVLDLGELDGKSLFEDFVEWKGSLAEAIGSDIEPIMKGEMAASGDQEAAREALRQQLRVELSNATRVDAIVQAPFQVTSPCSDAKTAARLVGTLVARFPCTPPSNEGVALEYMANYLSVEVGYLAEVIAHLPFVLAVGVKVAIDSGPVHAVNKYDTLESVAKALGLASAAELPGRIRFVEGKGLLAGSTTLEVARATASPTEGFTCVTELADCLDSTIASLLFANQDQPLFSPGTSITLVDRTAKVPEPGTPNQIRKSFGFSDLLELAEAIAVADAGFKVDRPYTLRQDAVMTSLRIPPTYSFSTAKLPLARTCEAQPRRYANTLLNVESQAAARYLGLDLDFCFTELEYHIVRDPELLGGYEQSSWLKFVRPFVSQTTGHCAIQNEVAEDSNATEFGPVKIPIPLRTYPDRVIIPQQCAFLTKDVGEALHDELAPGTDPARLPRWDYKFSANRLAAAQDIQTLRIWFNVPYEQESKLLEARSPREQLFAALVRFHHVSAALTTDLALLNNPDLSIEQRKIAHAAAKAFHTIAREVVAAWATEGPAYRVDQPLTPWVYNLRLLPSVNNPDHFGTLVLKYDSGPADRLFEMDVGEFLTPEALRGKGGTGVVRNLFRKAGHLLPDRITIIEPGERPDRGKDWWISDAENGRSYELRFVDSAVLVIEKILWPDIAVGAPSPCGGEEVEWKKLKVFFDEGVLDLGAGLPVSAPVILAYKFAGLDPLTRQNAKGSSAVSRNLHLLTGQETNPDFVYAAPEMAFPGLVTPSLHYSSEIDLHHWETPELPGLLKALSNFFRELTEEKRQAEPNGTVRMSLCADFQFPVTNPSRLTVGKPQSNGHGLFTGPPLLFVPAFSFQVATDWKSDPGTFVERLASTLIRRASEAGLILGQGRFRLSLSLFSTLKEASVTVPLVTYQSLVYSNRADRRA